MPEGDTIFKAACRVNDAIGGLVLRNLALPRVVAPLPRPGVRVLEARAQGKFLLVTLDDDHVIVTHLKMTGAWHIARPDARRPPASKLRVWLATDTAVALCVDAPVAQLLDSGSLRRHPGLRALGPDLCRLELDTTARSADSAAGADGALDSALAQVLVRAARFALRGTPISDLLLDQRVAAGIGNVYKSEICFLHGLHPLTPVERVADATRRELFHTGARLLQANCTTTERTTVEGGRPGALWVYGRQGRACRRCGTTIEAARTGGQSRVTTWCPTCQPLP